MDKICTYVSLLKHFKNHARLQSEKSKWVATASDRNQIVVIKIKTTKHLPKL